jgi:adenine-specific DNA-methyltransferase
LFYPIYVNNDTNRIVKIGNPLSVNEDKNDVKTIDGCSTVFPIDKGTIEGIWRLSAETARGLLEKGYFKVNIRKNGYSFSYLLDGVIKDIESGKVEIDGRDSQGCIIGHYQDGKEIIPATQWSKLTHDASQYGAVLLRSLLGETSFPYPKSLYAVRDCLDYFVRNKKNALVVDFFAGSGTTLHAVNLLNAEDGGHRRCVMVTNNEIGVKAEKRMKSTGFRPGDAEWEENGIARHVTWPRTVCSIEGHNVKGKPLKGSYIGSDIPMSDGFKSNAIFFKLGFLDKNAVALGRQFKELLGVIWMKAGAVGPCPHLGEDNDVPDMMVLPQNKMAILIDETAFAAFKEQVDQHPEIETVFIVTDSDRGYRDMLHSLNAKNTYQLYRNYLDNFRINHRR